MTADEDHEETLLRDVAMQNAKSIMQSRERAHQDLELRSEWLQTTLSSIGDAVISTDAHGRVTFMNAVAEKLTGWPEAEALGRPLTEVFRIVNDRTRQPAEDPALRALDEGTIVGLANHTVLIARDGTARPIDDSAAPIRTGRSHGPLGAVLVFRDVTQRKRAEEAQARLAAIVEASDDAIISKTLDGTILTWNKGAERLFGFVAEEAIGKPILLIIPPERHEEEERILEQLRRGERIEHFETIRVAKNGRRIDISLTVSPLFDHEGHVMGASKVARDISERKRAEQEQREADRRKDEFLALLAHELRNPLAPLCNGVQILRLAASDPDTVAQVRETMERQLEHMVRMIDDLLDIARISQNKIELRRVRVPLEAIIDSAVETARPKIEAEGHELAVCLPDEPIFLDADLTRLAQVFANLLTNSAKYTQRGGRIWLTAERHGGSVVITVLDTGIGIPAGHLPRIFDMFSQVERTTERSTGGLGIGLALVKGLVERHGGIVTAQSEGPGKGSSFTVCLPVIEEISRPVTSEPLTELPFVVGPRRRVLVVDDNRDSAISLAKLLTLMGNKVYTAHNGHDAFRLSESHRPEIILMDVGMPGQNGYETTRRIRQQPWGRAIVIIALTGWGQEGDRIQSREAGCDGHLVKPVHFADLEKMLSEFTSTV